MGQMPEGEKDMGKTAQRVGALGFVVAASAGLFFTNSASAAPGPDPLLKGDCEATVSAEDGTPVTVDLGALVNRPGSIDVGLGSKATNATGGKPLLNLPVTDALDALGITKVPGLRDVTTGVCKPVQALANKAAGGVQTLAAPVTGDDNLPAPPDEKPPPTAPPTTPPPTTPPPTDPGTPTNPGDQISPIVTAPGDGVGTFTGVQTSFPLGVAINGLPPIAAPIIPPGVVPPAAPSLGSPEQPQETKPPTVIAQPSSVEALPASTPPARLPLLLAVVALAIVAAALVRTWMRRKAA